MNIIFEINGKYYKKVQDPINHGCDICVLNSESGCGSLSWTELSCGNNHYEELEIEPTKEMIRKVLRLSKKHQARLLSEEKIKYIKDHWNEETKK